MTITYVSTVNGTPADNADVVFGALPTGWAAGDLHVIFASIRSSGTGTVDDHVDFETLWEFGNVKVMGRIAAAGDTPPTVTFSGGAVGDTTLAQMMGLRGASLDLVAVAELLNASAQNINYPALDVPMDNTMIILFAWKQDDMGTITVPAGMTSANTISSVLGSDAAQTLRYQIQTTEADWLAGTLTITGGAVAISRALMLAVRPAPALTVDEQDTWPARVLVSATGLNVGDAVELYRVAGGVRTLVRAGADDSITDPSFLRLDAELPFGVPVHYVLVVDGRDLATSATATYTLTGGKVAISDAITGEAVETVILAWDERNYTRRSSVFPINGVNIVVSDPMPGFESDLELFTEVTSVGEQLVALLRDATQGIVQIRQPGGYDGVDCHVGVLGVRERRFSQDGSDERRRWVCSVAQVSGWAVELEASGYTLQDIADVYTGLTLDDLSDDFATLLAIAQAEFVP